MAKQPTITTITSTNNTSSTLNANFQAIKEQFDLFVSRNGDTPNTMTAALDLNSQDILNIAQLNADSLKLGGTLVTNLAVFPTDGGLWQQPLHTNHMRMYSKGASGMSVLLAILQGLSAAISLQAIGKRLRQVTTTQRLLLLLAGLSLGLLIWQWPMVGQVLQLLQALAPT